MVEIILGIGNYEVSLGEAATFGDISGFLPTNRVEGLDEALSGKANASEVYTKSETDGLLGGKANTSEVYTKAETNTLLDNKANASDLASKQNKLTAGDNITIVDDVISASGSVDDVQINGTSIVVDKVANIPYAGEGVYGVTTVSGEKVDAIENRVDVLEKMSKGILYDFVTQTVEGTQSIPKGSHLADVQKLEGKSIVWNQLFDKSGYNDSSTINGVTFTNNNDGSFTVNGTATADAKFYSGSNVGSQINGHKYLLRGCPFGGSNTTYKLRTYGTGADFHDFGVGSITTSTTTSAYKPFQIEIYAGTTVNNLVFKPRLFDLTQMFGAGNEPTIEQFEAMFPNDYYPYNVGELQSVDNSKITVRGKNLCDLSKFEYVSRWVGNVNAYMLKLKVKPNAQYTLSSNVPYNTNTNLYFDSSSTQYGGVWLDTPKTTRADSEGNLYIAIADDRTYTNDLINGVYWIQLEEGAVATDYSPYSETEIPLAFVGKSAGTVRDELDLVNKKYIQRVGVVDLGSLRWVYYSDHRYFQADIATIKVCSSYSAKANLICTKYLNNTPNAVCDITNEIDKAISGHINPYIWVKDLSFTDAQNFNSAMQGVMLYYELAEPIITDVSTVIDSFEVEGNGTIEFDSSIPVKNTIEYLRYLNEV